MNRMVCVREYRCEIMANGEREVLLNDVLGMQMELQTTKTQQTTRRTQRWDVRGLVHGLLTVHVYERSRSFGKVVVRLYY